MLVTERDLRALGDQSGRVEINGLWFNTRHCRPSIGVEVEIEDGCWTFFTRRALARIVTRWELSNE